VSIPRFTEIYTSPFDLLIEMTNKKYIGQLVSIRYSDRPTPTFGFVIDYSDDWILLKYNPVDYIVDGYIILRNKNIEGIRRDANEKFREKVIILKKQHLPVLSDFPLTDLETILTILTKKIRNISV
jgi:hypothetical protein